jgi:hypothetical protein
MRQEGGGTARSEKSRGDEEDCGLSLTCGGFNVFSHLFSRGCASTDKARTLFLGRLVILPSVHGASCQIGQMMAHVIFHALTVSSVNFKANSVKVFLVGYPVYDTIMVSDRTLPSSVEESAAPKKPTATTKRSGHNFLEHAVESRKPQLERRRERIARAAAKVFSISKYTRTAE